MRSMWQKEAGCIVSFDPNLRPPLWKSLDEAKAEIEYGLSKCDILKISDNEVEFLFGTTDYDEGARLIRENIRFRWYSLPLEKTEAVHIIKISG